MNIKMDDLLEYFQISGSAPDVSPRFNIAPSQDVAAVRVEGTERRLALLRWGLIPHWADDPKIGYKMINARGETVHKLPSFRAAFRKRRCIIPAGGFFEWLRKEKEKQAFYIFRQDGAPLALAGLWEHWHSEEEGRDVESCAIITTSANTLVGRLHDRMPVILEPDDFRLWLDPQEESPEKLTTLLRPSGEDVLEMYPVSKYVNKAQNEGAQCIERNRERLNQTHQESGGRKDSR